ncbi:hypothetical protein KAW43_01280 [Candidatus Parcubacteria bacterium]|nr:hypothetical protein [Candidatus Parcubacteria bacterium]
MGNVLDKINEVVEKEKKSRKKLTSEAMIEEIMKCMAKAAEIGKVLEIAIVDSMDSKRKIRIAGNYLSIPHAGWSNLLVQTSDTLEQQLYEIFAGGLDRLWEKGTPVLAQARKIWEDIILSENFSVKIVR